MTFRDQTPNPVDRLAAELRRTLDRLDVLEKRGMVIPVLDDDPVVDDPTNMWLLSDGRLRARDAEGRIREWVPSVDARPQVPAFFNDPSVSSGWRMWLDAGTGRLRIRNPDDTVLAYFPDAGAGGGSGGEGSSGGGRTTDPKPNLGRVHQHRQTWSATGAGDYCPRHGREGPLYYGRYSATHGERRVMYGFNASDIRAALSGAKIKKVELRVRNLHSYFNGGVDVHWGGHRNGSLGGGFSQSYRNVWRNHWPKVGGYVWRTMPRWFGDAFRDDKIRGLTIDQPSGSLGYYGQMGTDLQVRITYTHQH